MGLLEPLPGLSLTTNCLTQLPQKLSRLGIIRIFIDDVPQNLFLERLVIGSGSATVHPGERQSGGWFLRIGKCPGAIEMLKILTVAEKGRFPTSTAHRIAHGVQNST